MRCPKCHYIGFEEADRCRNCGYDFSLLAPASPPAAELPLNHRDEDPLPPVDLSLSQVEGLHEARESVIAAHFDVDRVQTQPRDSATPLDLPLFRTTAATARDPRPAVRGAIPGDEDAPLLKAPAVPRAPIAVRRAIPESQRLRPRYPQADVPRLALEPSGPATVTEFPEVEIDLDVATAEPVLMPAPAGRRLLAACIDLAIVLGIDVGVLYFTLKLCELPLSLEGLAGIPIVPLAGFLVLLDAGYAITFTAAVGQTIGKMAMRLKVVHLTDHEDDDRPHFGFAILRTAAYAASILPVGLGFLPALLGKDRRALHDRLAETRVVYWGQVVKS